jgi:hypothetical protein
MLSALKTKDDVLSLGVGIGLLVGFQMVGCLCLLMDCLHR